MSECRPVSPHRPEKRTSDQSERGFTGGLGVKELFHSPLVICDGSFRRSGGSGCSWPVRDVLGDAAMFHPRCSPACNTERPVQYRTGPVKVTGERRCGGVAGSEGEAAGNKIHDSSQVTRVTCMTTSDF